jgi:hypothetical protein
LTLGNERGFFRYEADASGCDLLVTWKTIGIVQSDQPGVSQGTTVFTIPLGQLDPSTVSWYPDGDNGTYACVRLATRDAVIHEHSNVGNDIQQRSLSPFCFNDQGLAQQAVTVVTDMARSCGAQ